MAINEQSRLIKLPANIINDISKIKKAEKQLEADPDGIINNETISDLIGINTDEVSKLIRLSKSPFSIYDVLSVDNSDNENIVVDDVLFDESYNCENIVLNNMTHDKLLSTMKRLLTDREYNLIKYRFGLFDGKAYSLLETGKLLGITRQRANQLETEALQKLRNDTELISFMFGEDYSEGELNEIQNV